MLEIDRAVWDISSEFFPSYNNFSNERLSLNFVDAHEWYSIRYPADLDCSVPEETKFDLVIFDLVDIEDTSKNDDPSAENAVVRLFMNNDFFKRVYCSLRPDGAVSIQMGPAPESHFLTSRN